MSSQTSGGVAWGEAAGGRALVCTALRPIADHLFTTREWALGSNGAVRDADWEPVAAAVGVDGEHFMRMHQVHGAGVIVRRAGDRTPVTARPDADIVVSDD